ncbi:TIGR00266 family protein [Archangium gephyra]|uniref:TIGR00266 family protein n=1 Tax=Archangium gephyra TaxID=48 RepID=UPI0035D50269
MEAEIRNKPSFANVRVHMRAGDGLVAEADAMASMSPSIEMKARMAGGFFTALVRRVFGKESFFVNEFATQSQGELVLTQPVPGDIISVALNGNSLFLQQGAFLACEPGVKLGVGWAGIASLVGGEGLFRLNASGTGTLWFGAYGGITEKEVNGELIVDSGHLVAYEPTLILSMGLAGGIFSSFFSGEGLITRVRGRGKIYLQSRALAGLASWTNSNIY